MHKSCNGTTWIKSDYLEYLIKSITKTNRLANILNADDLRMHWSEKIMFDEKALTEVQNS